MIILNVTLSLEEETVNEQIIKQLTKPAASKKHFKDISFKISNVFLSW